MDQQQLQDWLDARAGALSVPGVSIGVLIDGEEHYACYGVTSVENPLEVTPDTIFCYGSTGKTFTATAIMRLVEQAKVDLDEPVRTYVPELKLKDEECAANVTVKQLLNHTAGWSGDVFGDHGDGDDALERFVAAMADLEQVTPLGASFSYNNAALDLAGHLIAKVTGKTYEAAMRELVLDPVGLDNTWYFPNDVMTRRFAVGHNEDKDGNAVVQRPWAMSRAGAPSGGFGVSASIRDQIKWARFHMSDGNGVLKKETLDLMKQPTFEISGGALGNAVGISWFLADAGGAQTVSHGGDVLGQHSEFVMVPERNFAVAVLTNCDGSGSIIKDEAVKFALESYLGLVAPEPQAIKLGDDELAAYVGDYETIAVVAHIALNGNGGLQIAVDMKPETRKMLQQQGEEIPEQPPIPFGFIEGEPDRYVVTEGPAKGMRGYFVRDADGNIESVHVGGRLATKVKASVPA